MGSSTIKATHGGRPSQAVTKASDVVLRFAVEVALWRCAYVARGPEHTPRDGGVLSVVASKGAGACFQRAVRCGGGGGSAQQQGHMQYHRRRRDTHSTSSP